MSLSALQITYNTINMKFYSSVLCNKHMPLCKQTTTLAHWDHEIHVVDVAIFTHKISSSNVLYDICM